MKIHVTDREGNVHVVEGKTGETLMMPLHGADLVEATCSGSCSCATCHVYIAAESLPKLPTADSEETDMLDFIVHSKEDSRLACQIVLSDDIGDISVTVAPEEGF